MTMDPSTGEGFDAVEVDSADYFDPNATSDSWPGVVGLEMRRHTFWQGDVQFDTFEEIGPTSDSITVSSPGGNADGSATGPDVVIRPVSTFIPLIGTREFAISIELHGCYGFPDASGDPDPTLTYNTVCKIPILPEVINPTFPSNNHWSVQMVGGGEVLVPGNEMLESVTIKSFWPVDYDDSLIGISENDFNAQGTPAQVIANLIWSKRRALPLRLVIGDPGIFSDYVIITDFDYSHIHGTLDYDYTIGLKRLKSTSIISVANPDADTDHFSTIPLSTPPVQGPDLTAEALRNGEQPVTDDPSISDNVDTPPAVTPETVFPDADVGRQAQTQGQVQNPIVDVVVLPRSDSNPLNDLFTKVTGGNDIGSGETLNQVASRMGVTWEGVQKDLNPQYANLDPNFHLQAGAHLKIALATPTITKNSHPLPATIGPFGPQDTSGQIGTIIPGTGP
jgi:hypothetical protein